MEKILVINPAIASANLGDFIIEEVTQQYIKEWFSDAFISDIPSHTPINNLYFYSLRKPTHTLVTGTNLLQNFPLSARSAMGYQDLRSYQTQQRHPLWDRVAPLPL